MHFYLCPSELKRVITKKRKATDAITSHNHGTNKHVYVVTTTTGIVNKTTDALTCVLTRKYENMFMVKKARPVVAVILEKTHDSYLEAAFQIIIIATIGMKTKLSILLLLLKPHKL